MIQIVLYVPYLYNFNYLFFIDYKLIVKIRDRVFKFWMSPLEISEVPSN